MTVWRLSEAAVRPLNKYLRARARRRTRRPWWPDGAHTRRCARSCERWSRCGPRAFHAWVNARLTCHEQSQTTSRVSTGCVFAECVALRLEAAWHLLLALGLVVFFAWKVTGCCLCHSHGMPDPLNMAARRRSARRYASVSRATSASWTRRPRPYRRVWRPRSGPCVASASSPPRSPCPRACWRACWPPCQSPSPSSSSNRLLQPRAAVRHQRRAHAGGPAKRLAGTLAHDHVFNPGVRALGAHAQA